MRKEHTFAVAGRLLAGLLGLLAIEWLAPILPNQGATRYIRQSVAITRGRNPMAWNWGIIRDETSGYYERLLTRADDQPAGKTLLAWLYRLKRADSQHQVASPYVRGGVLCYQPKPSLNWVGPDDPKEMMTDRFGLVDQEYTKNKPAGTRRVALIGDSLSRGYGVPIGKRFESLFENYLNTDVLGTTGERFEVLNFAVDGYRITQLFYVAVEKAPIFQPDVYLLTLTQVGVSPDWGSHLAQLVREKTDLRYDFLRETVRTAGLRRQDEGAVVRSKLAPYRLRVLGEVLARVKEHVERESAELIVLLLPGVEDQELITSRFRGIRDVVDRLGITTVDLMDTYASVPDIETVRISWADLHPNAVGHRLIADNLVRKLRRQPAACAALIGQKDSIR